MLPLFCSGQNDSLVLSSFNAANLATVPLECIFQEYPNKLNQVIGSEHDLESPSELHPIFYGCFDWHSSVHGHWMLARISNKFKGSAIAHEIDSLFDLQFTAGNVEEEVSYFMTKLNKSFERTYGWAWYLKLIAELNDSELNMSHAWTKNLQPLTEKIVALYKEFLPKLVYPIRVGEHTNTAFGLSLALDYARAVEDKAFEQMIIDRSKDFYIDDKGCPISWEPSGFDFISPCLQEAELMSKVLSSDEFTKWLKGYMPQLLKKKFSLEPGKVLDRTDGKLVHLDGLNFCRAWCLYGLAKVLPKQRAHLIEVGDKHVRASMNEVVGSDYMGSHWLASFYIRAMEAREEASMD